jgi:hypothetical protein
MLRIGYPIKLLESMGAWQWWSLSSLFVGQNQSHSKKAISFTWTKCNITNTCIYIGRLRNSFYILKLQGKIIYFCTERSNWIALKIPSFYNIIFSVIVAVYDSLCSPDSRNIWQPHFQFLSNTTFGPEKQHRMILLENNVTRRLSYLYLVETKLNLLWWTF